MKNQVIKLLLQFVKFGLVGVSNVFIAYFFYTICIQTGTGYLVANTAGYIGSVSNAFLWNNRFVFKKGATEKRTLWKAFLKSLISYAGTGLILNNVLLVIWIDFLQVPEMLGPAINVVVDMPINFLLHKFWAFRKETVADVSGQEVGTKRKAK